MLTKTGAAVGISAGALLGGGVLADYPELVMVGLAGASALLVAAVWMLARPQLTARRDIHPGRVFEGSAAHGMLTVTNVGRRRSPSLVVTETVAGHSTSVPLPSLAGGHSCEARYPLPAARRGRYVIPAMAIGQSDPLRLLRRGHGCGDETVLYVYPRIHALSAVGIGGPHDAEGPTSSIAPDRGGAFHSLREYVPGDDFRLIHWRSTARTGTLMTRCNVVPDEPRQLIVLDTSADPYTGELFEDAVRVAASLCVAADRAGFPLELRTTGIGVDTQERPGGLWGAELPAALARLSTVECSGSDVGLLDLVAIVRDVFSRDEGVALTVVTGRVGQEQAELLSSVRSRFLSVTLVQLGEFSPPQSVRPRGVVAFSVRSSEEFAAAWNQLGSQ